jgi:glycosyltransferase involved in cell wall biosynthesis
MRWVTTISAPEPVSGEHNRKRVLVLTRYGALAASTRVRFLQFIERFEHCTECPLSFDVAPLLEDNCLQYFHDFGTRRSTYLFKRYLRRLMLLLGAKHYDLLWIEKEVFPALPAFAEHALRRMGIRIVVDYDDATYTWYRNHPSWLVRALLGRKIDAVCRAAHTVVAGNKTLASYARSVGAQNVIVVPSVIDTERYVYSNQKRPDPTTFVIGWIGQPSNVRYLDMFKDALATISREGGVTFLTIGAPDHLFADVPQQAHAWSESAEVALLSECDCMLAPLGDGEFQRGKCGFKVIQGMAAALPVIASPVGVISEIIRHGENGFLAENSDECYQYLCALRRDPALRRRLGESARRTVEEFYSVSAVHSQLLDVLKAPLGDTGAHDQFTGGTGSPSKIRERALPWTSQTHRAQCGILSLIDETDSNDTPLTDTMQAQQHRQH